MSEKVNLEKYDELVKEHKKSLIYIEKMEQEIQRLRTENPITIRKIVKPPRYEKDMERLRQLEKKVKNLERIIEYGNISTVSNIVNEFKTFSISQIERLSRELQFYVLCQEEYEDLVNLIEYLEKAKEELEKFLLRESDSSG